MDIYILRSGEEIGPLSELTVQTLLKQGSILLNDPAWRPGMADWIPLHSVLYPAASQAQSQNPSQGKAVLPEGSTPPAAASRQPVAQRPLAQTRTAGPVRGPSHLASAVSVLPASAKQKAFLSFMGIAFPPDITREQAAMLTQAATEDPSDPQRLALWNAERLRLHPDLFPEEIQAKKDNRAAVFLQVIQTEGAEFFSKVTKAHCQVLMGALDVRFPSWDTGDPESVAWNYVFPALAEKFPQLMSASANGKFKFPGESASVSRQAVHARTASLKATPKRNPFGAVLRGLIWGGVILAGLYFSKDRIQPWTDQIEHWFAQAQGKVAKPMPASSGQALDATASGNGAEKKKAQKNEALNASASSAGGGRVTKSDDSKAGSAQPSDSVKSASAETPAAAPKTILVLTKPAEVQLAFGKVVLQPGTQLKLIASEGDNLRVLYGKDTLVLPASSTDYVAPTVAPAGAPVAPAKPAVSPNSLF